MNFYSEVIDWHTGKVIRSIGWDTEYEANLCKDELNRIIDGKREYARVRPSGYVPVMLRKQAD